MPGTDLDSRKITMKGQFRVPKTRQARKSVVLVQCGKDCDSGRVLWSREGGCQAKVPCIPSNLFSISFAHLSSFAHSPKASSSCYNACVTLQLQSAPRPEGTLVFLMVIILLMLRSLLNRILHCQDPNLLLSFYRSSRP